MTAPKVCIFTETYYPVIGGGETQARSLAEGLVANGFSVIILTRRSHLSLSKIERFGDVTVYRLPPTGNEHLKKWGLLLSSVPALIKLRHRYDLIFVSGFRVIGLSAVPISKLLGKACILKADSLGEMSGDFFRDGLAKLRLSSSSLIFKLFLALRNRILRGASVFVAISEEIATELATHGVDLAGIQNHTQQRRYKKVSPPLTVRKSLNCGKSLASLLMIGCSYLPAG